MITARVAGRSSDTVRRTHDDGTVFANEASYSRAVRSGRFVAVSGTAPIDSDGKPRDGGLYEQTLFALEKALAAAEALGARREDVLRTRLLLAPGTPWEDAARAHGEFFAGVRPANTTYFVGGFIPDVLVEVELDAVVSDGDDAHAG
jgi:enamine deaminase RidA (YjgF/YER057c/UK114 family)